MPRVPERLQKPHEAEVYRIMRDVWDRLNRKNEHFVMPIVGREGIGKSHTAIKIATVLDPDFDTENIFFRARRFLKMLRDGEYSSGDVYLLDEAGVSFGKRTWQDKAQIKANQAMQLIRDHNIGVLFTLPRLSELDSQTQGRAHAFYEIVEKKEGKHVWGKWKWIDPDRSGTTGKVYKKYPRSKDGDRIERVGFTPPPRELVSKYDDQKAEFQEEVYQEAISELDDGDGGSNDGSSGDKAEAKAVAERIIEEDELETVTGWHGGHNKKMIDTALIEMEYDLSAREAKKAKKLLEKRVTVPE